MAKLGNNGKSKTLRYPISISMDFLKKLRATKADVGVPINQQIMRAWEEKYGNSDS